MSNEKSRGTMLTSTALILCCVTFGAGFLCGDLVSEYRRAGVPAASAQSQQCRTGAAGFSGTGTAAGGVSE